jgi:hypothetical protein
MTRLTREQLFTPGEIVKVHVMNRAVRRCLLSWLTRRTTVPVVHIQVVQIQSYRFQVHHDRQRSRLSPA